MMCPKRITAANAIELVRKGKMQVSSLNEYLGNSKHRNLSQNLAAEQILAR